MPWRAGGLEPADREAALDELRAVAERLLDREHDAVPRALRDAVQADPQPGGEFDREHPDPGMRERRFERVAGWWIGREDQPTVVQGAGKPDVSHERRGPHALIAVRARHHHERLTREELSELGRDPRGDVVASDLRRHQLDPRPALYLALTLVEHFV